MGRIAWSSSAVKILKSEFAANKYPSIEAIDEIALKLKPTMSTNDKLDRKVANWFKNQRTRSRKATQTRGNDENSTIDQYKQQIPQPLTMANIKTEKFSPQSVAANSTPVTNKDAKMPKLSPLMPNLPTHIASFTPLARKNSKMGKMDFFSVTDFVSEVNQALDQKCNSLDKSESTGESGEIDVENIDGEDFVKLEESVDDENIENANFARPCNKCLHCPCNRFMIPAFPTQFYQSYKPNYQYLSYRLY